jgi:hypothetical protein
MDQAVGRLFLVIYFQIAPTQDLSGVCPAEFYAIHWSLFILAKKNSIKVKPRIALANPLRLALSHPSLFQFLLDRH